MGIANNSFDVTLLTEAHLVSSITNVEIFGREYCIYRKDRQQGGRFGCGVLITTKGCIEASPREDLDC